MSQKYKRTTIILAVILLFIVFELYFNQPQFVLFFKTYMWIPFRDFINGKFGWIVYGVIAPIVILIGIMVAGKKWFGWRYEWLTNLCAKVFKKKK